MEEIISAAYCEKTTIPPLAPVIGKPSEKRH